MAWTTNQQKVIDTRDSNILVSAAAGSGKTAVLVERIIKRVLDENNPLDIDRLLVVTFTNAAATEMRERVLNAIEKELEKNPESEHLQRQNAYIHSANIMTMHSFCLKMVKENFNKLDLDPGVRIADTGELELLKSDVLKEVIEEYYSEGKDDFKNFVAQFETKNSDKMLEDIIYDLYNKAVSHPWPDMWFQKCLSLYDVKTVEELEDTPHVRRLKEYADEMVNQWCEKYELMDEICRENGLDVFKDKIYEEFLAIKEIKEAKTFDRRRVKLNYAFATLRGGSGEKDNPEAKEMVQELRNEVKDQFKKLKEKIYFQSLSQALDEIGKCRPVIKTYIDITKTFMDKFKEKKRDRNIIDFNDFEHYAIELLTINNNGEIEYTDMANEIAWEFEEVMVDEYQDSNMVQETILDAVSKNRFGIYNRFMVGDVKQSIYGFRGAEPSIFVNKYDSYSFDESLKQGYKIVLDKNFRSRPGVLGTTNYIFSQIMGKELGGIEYDENNMLYPGADYPEPEKGNVLSKSELVFVIPPDYYGTEEGMTSNESEAYYIAKRIKELLDKRNNYVVYDKEKKCYRNIKYSDIVILVRAVGVVGDTINSELTRSGIPCQMESRSGYFKTIEIRNIVNLLKVIDNPRQDIPMLSVLKSPFVGLNEEEIAKVRVWGGKDKTLYENVCVYVEYDMKEEAEEDDRREYDDRTEQEFDYDQELKVKLLKFTELLDEFRIKVTYTSLYDLICQLLNKTEYYSYVKAMPSGKQRQANVEMFKEKAAAYEKGSYKGLFNFIRYIEKMNKYDIDMGEASILSEADNVVRIMTIHKSKGLEFPVVFLAYLNKGFNEMDTNKRQVIDFDYGIGMDFIDTDTRIKTKNIFKAAIVNKMRQNILEEEIRILYVACTRAREKLIMTANGISEKEFKKLVLNRKNYNPYYGYATVSGFKSLCDMVANSMSRNQAFDNIFDILDERYERGNSALYSEDANIDIKIYDFSDAMENEIRDKVSSDMNVLNLSNLPTDYVYLEDEHNEIKSVLEYEYPYSEEVTENAKISVSDIKKISYETAGETEENEGERMFMSLDEINISEERHIIPEFIEKKEIVAGAARGTAYHTVFEMFDFDMEPTEENIEKMLDQIEEKGRLSKEERACIKVRDLINFANSDLGQRMKNAYLRNELYREAQFVMGIYESDVEEYRRIAREVGENKRYLQPELSEKKGDIILIQGIIDVYFIEDGKVVIADYKTDKIKEMKDLKEHYYVQLELYKHAVEQLTGLSVSEKLLYSVSRAKTISCEVE